MKHYFLYRWLLAFGFLLSITFLSLNGNVRNILFQSSISSSSSITKTVEEKSPEEKEGFVFPDVIYGHVHISKTAGSTINEDFANKFERVCGNKGASYNQYMFETIKTNRMRAAKTNRMRAEKTNRIKMLAESRKGGRRTRERREGIFPGINRTKEMVSVIGLEDCDYVSFEVEWDFWPRTFRHGKLHNIPVELHVPCRDPVDHILSQCNHKGYVTDTELKIDCDGTDEDFYKSIRRCYNGLVRFHFNLTKNFDVKCVDFKKQFTTYFDYMADKLQPRRLVYPHVMKFHHLLPRNKTAECIWDRPDLMEKAKQYLLDNVSYYQFCDTCIGSDDDITHINEEK